MSMWRTRRRNDRRTLAKSRCTENNVAVLKFEGNSFLPLERRTNHCRNTSGDPDDIANIRNPFSANPGPNQPEKT